MKQDAFGLFFAKSFSVDSKLVRDMPIGSMTTMGVGGAATWYAEPSNLSDLSTLVEGCDYLIYSGQ